MARKPPPLVQAGLVSAGVVLLQGLLVAWFAWPSQQTAPRDLPVVVAGPAPVTGPVADRLRAAHPGAFAVSTAPDTAAADLAIRDRNAYAAFVFDRGAVSLHVASAAGPAVSTLLGQAAQQLGDGRQVPVVDVVPAPAGDPRGAGFATGLLPLVLTSVACGVVLLFVVGSHAVRLVGLLAFAVLAGAVAVAVMHGLGVLTGPYLPAAGAVGLLALAISAAVAGLGAALGRAGLGLGVLLAFLLGTPISGLGSAPELLPRPWGTLGQLLPPGAGGTLLRSVAFFDGAAAARPALVLGCWALVGLALTAVSHYHDRIRGAAAPEPVRQSRSPHQVSV